MKIIKYNRRYKHVFIQRLNYFSDYTQMGAGAHAHTWYTTCNFRWYDRQNLLYWMLRRAGIEMEIRPTKFKVFFTFLFLYICCVYIQCTKGWLYMLTSTLHMVHAVLK